MFERDFLLIYIYYKLNYIILCRVSFCVKTEKRWTMSDFSLLFLSLRFGLSHNLHDPEFLLSDIEMENLFGFHCAPGYSDPSPMVPSLQPTGLQDSASQSHHLVPLDWTSATGPYQFARSGSSSSVAISDTPSSAVAEVQRGEPSLEEEEEVSRKLRAKIACHPLYPKLLEAYIDCQKV